MVSLDVEYSASVTVVRLSPPKTLLVVTTVVGQSKNKDPQNSSNSMVAKNKKGKGLKNKMKIKP